MKCYGTLGPACQQTDTLVKLIESGMTGVRLNLSHKNLDQSKEWISHYQEAMKLTHTSGDFLIDLMGPELRIGTLEDALLLKEDAIISLGEKGIPTPEEVLQVLNVGQKILLDDGKLELEVIDLYNLENILCKVLRGGKLTSRKSVALPGCEIKNPTLTKQDFENIAVAKAYGVNEVMLPFVRGKEDLITLRKALDEAGGSDIRIFAKIENLDGVNHLEELMPHCDTIVIARGDLGNAMPLSKLPVIQSQIARKCKEYGCKFMVVTQMLNSMVTNPVPTRAEVSDIFHAVEQGADSVMLTGETAAGKYPVEAMKVMVDTVKWAKEYLENENI